MRCNPAQVYVLCYGLSLYASYHGVKTALDSFVHLRDADKVPHLRDHIEEFETFMDYESFARRAEEFEGGVISRCQADKNAKPYVLDAVLDIE